jgi:hypothetical protein
MSTKVRTKRNDIDLRVRKVVKEPVGEDWRMSPKQNFKVFLVPSNVALWRLIVVSEIQDIFYLKKLSMKLLIQ